MYEHEVLWMPHRFCSHGCSYCSAKPLRDNEKREGMRRNIEAGVAYIRKFCGKTKALITLDGGEISETPGFVELCQNLAKDYYLAIYTNLHENSWLDFVGKVPVDRVDHIWASNHRKQTLDRFVEHVRVLKEAGYSIVGNITMHPDRIKDIPELEGKLKELNVSLDCGLYFESGVLKNDSSVRKYLRFKGEQDRLSGNGFVSTVGRKCWSGSNAIIITDSGDIRGCAHDGTVLGNIFKGTANLGTERKVCPLGWCSCLPYLIRGYIEGRDETPLLDKLSKQYIPFG